MVGLIASWAITRDAQGEKPNIIVISTDDAAYSDFGFTSALHNRPTQIETPNLDLLAQQSVIGSQAYVAHSLCGPSRAGLLTGQYQQRYGFEDNIASSIDSPKGLSSEQVTMATRLKELNYTTGIVGKWHLGFVDGENRPLDKGFDEFYGVLDGSRSYFTQTSPERSIYKQNQEYEQQYRVEGDPSRYDPVRGRYLTDAFGEEAASFINRHAADENPFFMYVSLTGPHEPWQAKQQDLDHFAHITNEQERYIAAMTYAVDRAVGDVTSALAANGIDDQTIVVFTNDNGAVHYVLNPPFRGHKGTTFEGGIRVPFLIKAPGLAPGIYDDPLSMFDMLPTFYAAGGGDVSQIPHDGIDVMPYLKGEEVQDPDRTFFWRSQDKWAIRKGDWKLTSPMAGFTGMFLFNIAEDPDENNYSYYYSRPDKRAELAREFTMWESQMAKPEWGAIGANIFNTFDHFNFRVDQTNTLWNTASAWRKGGGPTIVTLLPSDAYPNAILEFGVRNDADYISTNNMTRWSKFAFMLNEMRFSGNFSGLANHSGTINGNTVLFVKSLTGQLPTIRLDAASSSEARFGFHLDLEVQLLHDLEITGDGTQDFVIGGAICDYYEPLQPNISDPHSVRKTGTSKVTLSGNNTFKGTLTIEQGQVTLQGPSAAIAGAAGITIHDDGNFTLASGAVTVPWINKSAGGQFHFNGGTLKVRDFGGNLANTGGIYSPGQSVALSRVHGSFSQSAGRLVVELGGADVATQYDALVVEGSANVGGILDVDFLNSFAPTSGQSFQVLTASDGISGTFSQADLPALASGLFWNVLYGTHSVILAIAPTAALGSIPGDFNADGTVDAADYTVWRDHLGSSSTAADANFDGQVTTADYHLWKSHFGFSLTNAGVAAVAAQAVPEPAGVAALLLGLLGLIPLAGRCGCRNS
jgi:autotransporter-associated beta strand protein